MPWLMAAIYDRFMRASEQRRFQPWRQQLLASLEGEVLEVGAGTGANLPHYPSTVSRLVLSEPDPAMRSKLARRLQRGHHPEGLRLELSDATLPHLPFEDARFDAVVATLVLCSVDDVAEALGEVRRVLRPGGRLLFLEHVASGDEDHRRWQRRIEPLWKRVGGNCHLTRETEEALVAAGFTLERVDRHVERRRLLLVRDTVRGVARSPAGAR